MNLKRSFVAVAVTAGVLATAGSATAATQQSGLITYNGHAGLGASGYEHNQTELEFLASTPQIQDGTSNTIMFGERSPRP